MSNYLTIKEASELTGVSSKTIRRYVLTGVITSKNVKGRRGMEYRVLKSSLMQYFRRIGYGEPGGEPADEQEGELLVRLRHLVPRYLYDDVMRSRDELLGECGRLKERLKAVEEPATTTDRKTVRSAPASAAGRGPAADETETDTLATLRLRIESLERENTELKQTMAEKDTLIGMLEKPRSRRGTSG